MDQSKRDVKLARWAGARYRHKSTPRRGWLLRRSVVDGRRYILRPGTKYFARRGSTVIRTAPKTLQHRQARRLGLLGLPLPRAGPFAPERPRKESRAKRLHRHLRWVEAVTADWR